MVMDHADRREWQLSTTSPKHRIGGTLLKRSHLKLLLEVHIYSSGHCRAVPLTYRSLHLLISFAQCLQDTTVLGAGTRKDIVLEMCSFVFHVYHSKFWATDVHCLFFPSFPSVGHFMLLPSLESACWVSSMFKTTRLCVLLLKRSIFQMEDDGSCTNHIPKAPKTIWIV